MSLPFDATLKDIVQTYLPDFTGMLGLHEPGPPQVLNVDLSTISAATDIALGFGVPLATIYDVNFQSSRDAGLAARLLVYNVLLYQRFGVPVHTVVVLLRRAADDSDLTGKVKYRTRRRGGKMEFSFEVVRLWRLPVRSVLKGGLGTLPLAPLCRQPGDLPLETALPDLVRRIDARLHRETTPEDRRRLLSATYLMSGLRLPWELATQLFQGVGTMDMRDSSTYVHLLEVGGIETLQKVLLKMGTKRFGRPSEVVETAVKGINDLPRLERLSERLLDVSAWQELLDTP